MATDPFLDTFTGLLFLATLGLAFYTARLHGATVSLAKDTVDATKLSDRHHQEALSPVCVIRDVRCGKAGVAGAAQLAVAQFRIHNVGTGPAVYVKAIVTPGTSGNPTGTAYSYDYDPLQAGEVGPLIGPDNAVNMMTDVFFVVRVEYQSRFDTWGVSEWNVYAGGYGPLTRELPPQQQRV